MQPSAGVEWPRGPSPGSGFTLLEMMLVLAIVGILAGVVVMNFTDTGRQRQLRAEVERLARLVELARAEALRGNEIWGLTVDDGEFRFQRYHMAGGGWTQVRRHPFHARPPEEVVTFEIITTAGERERLTVQFETLGGTDEQEEDLPDVAIFPSGEVTPFEVVAFLGEKKPRDEDGNAWVAYTDGVQRVHVAPAGEEPRKDPRALLAAGGWRG